MPHFPSIDTLRQRVAEEFRLLGDDANEPPAEKIIIRGGCYRGRRFERSRLTAIWFAEEGEVKFFRPDGQLAHVVEVGTSDSAIHRRAA